MKDYKYEKVTDMTVGQVVDAMLEGKRFHYKGSHEQQVLDCDIDFIKFAIETDSLYQKIESPWWEKHVDSLVMVRDSSNHKWSAKFFSKYDENREFKFIDREGTRWEQMRPLTAAEKDAIITEG